jgi:hypothetical protein
MMDEPEPEARFGCARCWPPSAEGAWAARTHLSVAATTLDGFHAGVDILACPDCDQEFVSVFSELVDWVDGDDSQFWTQMPVTPAEAAGIVRRGEAIAAEDLAAVGSGRRSLRLEHARGEERRVFWATGVFVWWQ